MITGNASNTILAQHNLHGEGVLIGVGDTGLDVNHAFFYDPSQSISYSSAQPNLNHRKVVLYYDYQDRSEFTVGGHGTHVCGIIAGKTTLPTISQYNVGVWVWSDLKGLAYDAKIMFYDITNGAGVTSTPYNLYMSYLPIL